MSTREEGGSNIANEMVADNHDELSITIHHEIITENERQRLSSLVEKMRGSPEFGSSQNPKIGSSQKPKIQMVPKLHREMESNIRCYEPLVVAIGPVHHGKSKLQHVENCKELLAAQFADQEITKPRLSGVLSRLLTKSESIEELYRRVKTIAPNARKCYDEELVNDYNDEEFAWMMFLDGCFILQYVHCLVTDDYKKLQMNSQDIAFIRRDLFLLENQIPFEVLQVLMSCKFKKDEGMKMIQTFIASAHVKPPPSHGFIQGIKYLCIDFLGVNAEHPNSYTCTQMLKNLFGKIFEGERPSNNKQESAKTPPAHLLELLRTHLIDPDAFSEGGCYLSGEWCSYRSAQELKTAGIHFRPGKSGRLTDIKFDSSYRSAFLTLPPINIDDSTKSELLNLVAYEACPDTPDDFGVTSYLCFMDSLINHPEDVKELRSKGILLNYLGSDQEVANLFNEIARDLVPNPDAFISVKYKIEKHCNRFITPWTVVAFNTAILVICLEMISTGLTAIQSYYAVHPKGS